LNGGLVTTLVLCRVAPSGTQARLPVLYTYSISND